MPDQHSRNPTRDSRYAVSTTQGQASTTRSINASGDQRTDYPDHRDPLPGHGSVPGRKRAGVPLYPDWATKRATEPKPSRGSLGSGSVDPNRHLKGYEQWNAAQLSAASRTNAGVKRHVQQDEEEEESGSDENSQPAEVSDEEDQGEEEDDDDDDDEDDDQEGGEEETESETDSDASDLPEDQQWDEERRANAARHLNRNERLGSWLGGNGQ